MWSRLTRSRFGVGQRSSTIRFFTPNLETSFALLKRCLAGRESLRKDLSLRTHGASSDIQRTNQVDLMSWEAKASREAQPKSSRPTSTELVGLTRSAGRAHFQPIPKLLFWKRPQLAPKKLAPSHTPCTVSVFLKQQLVGLFRRRLPPLARWTPQTSRMQW